VRQCYAVCTLSALFIFWHMFECFLNILSHFPLLKRHVTSVHIHMICIGVHKSYSVAPDICVPDMELLHVWFVEFWGGSWIVVKFVPHYMYNVDISVIL
jgi:hypothetical protein